MSKTFRLAFGGIAAALALVAMIGTGLFPFATLALPALAGVFLIPVVVEVGAKWAWIAYGVVALLSFFVTPEPTAAWVFLLFFGYYPIVKSPVEGIRKPLLEWALKLLLLNGAFVLLLLVAYFLLGLPEMIGDSAVFGKLTFPILWLAVNGVFLVYDFALTRLIGGYMNWFRPNVVEKLRRNFR